MSFRVELSRNPAPVRAPTEWVELTLHGDESTASGTKAQLATVLTETPGIVDGMLIALFEPDFDAKTSRQRKGPRLFLGGRSAPSVADALIGRGWTRSRASRATQLTTDLFTSLRQVMLICEQRIVPLDWVFPVKIQNALASVGFTVAYDSIQLVPMDLAGMRRRVRLTYDFGCIDVLAVNKDEARGLVRLLRDDLPAGADAPLALREQRALEETPAAKVIAIIDDAELGKKESRGAYDRRWRNEAGKAAGSLARERPGPVTKPSTTPPRKVGPFGQARRKKN